MLDIVPDHPRPAYALREGSDALRFALRLDAGARGGETCNHDD